MNNNVVWPHRRALEEALAIALETLGHIEDVAAHNPSNNLSLGIRALIKNTYAIIDISLGEPQKEVDGVN